MRFLYEEDSPLSRVEVRLFKYLNTKKKKGADLLDIIKSTLPLLNKSKSEAKYYLELYTSNYRPEGDYENITNDSFVDIRDVKPKKTANHTAYEYTSSKIPFKGSNLSGRWDVNNSGDRYYVVHSYDWYPIYLFIDNQWYRVLDNYSSSTSKHLAHSSPVRYDSGLGEEVKMATPDELRELMRGSAQDKVFNKRITNFVEKVNNGSIDLIGKPLLRTIYGVGKVKFTVTNVSNENDKILIDIKINKAGKLVDRKMVEKPEYYQDEAFMNKIKTGIEIELLGTQNRFLTKNNTEFTFN